MEDRINEDGSAGVRGSALTFPYCSVYKKIIKSNLADNFYIRTHFDHEADSPIGLSFTRGEVFRVVDTMHRGKLGNWLAIRMGNDLHEMDKGTIPNQARSGPVDGVQELGLFLGVRASNPRSSSVGPKHSPR